MENFTGFMGEFRIDILCIQENIYPQPGLYKFMISMKDRTILVEDMSGERMFGTLGEMARCDQYNCDFTVAMGVSGLMGIRPPAFVLKSPAGKSVCTGVVSVTEYDVLGPMVESNNVDYVSNIPMVNIKTFASNALRWMRHM